MILTILGCGTSTGVPLIGCGCKVCKSKDPKDNRTRASVWVQTQNKSILIDTSTDLRAQALRAKIGRIDAVLFTHPHADHLNGIDEIRSFNFIQRETIPVYGNSWTCDELKNRFNYIFQPTPIEGGGIPQVDLKQFRSNVPSIDVVGVPVTPIALQHGSKECIGYRINSVAYVTDCSFIPAESMERLKGLSVLVLDCLRLTPHSTHFNLEQSLTVISQLKPKRTFLTHMGHDFGYKQWVKKLPKGITLAYDGLKIST
jgi:phosphoribosyl 1,2-cyclic phosphate phosphodiesterase